MNHIYSMGHETLQASNVRLELWKPASEILHIRRKKKENNVLISYCLTASGQPAPISEVLGRFQIFSSVHQDGHIAP